MQINVTYCECLLHVLWLQEEGDVGEEAPSASHENGIYPTPEEVAPIPTQPQLACSAANSDVGSDVFSSDKMNKTGR